MFKAVRFYIVEFHRKGLKDFAACRRYYDFLPQEKLEEEARLLLGEMTRILPIQIIFERCYALFYELLERATCSPKLTDEDRKRVVLLAIDTKEELLRRLPATNLPGIREVIRRHCCKVERMGRYKAAARLIERSNRTFKGPIRSVAKMPIGRGSHAVN